MYLSVVFLPLVTSVLVGFGGYFIGHQGASRLAPIGAFSTFFFALFIFYEVALCQSVCSIRLFHWITVGSLDVHWGFLFDTVTAVMLVVVTSVSALVHLYSTGYMSEDPHLPRFLSYLSLFTFFMLILVTADNLVQMFVGWEGVGLCSYLLINFWYNRVQANKSAIKAIIVNRVGDLGLTLGLVVIFATFKTLDFSVIFALAPLYSGAVISFLGYEVSTLDLVALLLFVGAVGKSAQLGLHTWLPDAMEGPTPVSALIHAATMVTAGVFVLIRMSPLLEYATFAMSVITVVGALTAFFAATTGMLQNDLKRVIAYSTCSQLGYMVFICGLSNYEVGMFHLYNHAFFKALLFLSAGVVIHGLADEQDMRRMGGLVKFFPFTYLMMLVGSLSLMGFPFLTGFYSKDVILEIAGSAYTVTGSFSYWLGTISAFFTAFYSCRLLYLTFLSKPNGYRVSLEHAHEAPWSMGVAQMVLFFGAVFAGFVSKDMFIGLGTDFWGSAIGSNIYSNNSVAVLTAEFQPASFKLLPVAFSLVAAALAFILYNSFAKFLVFVKTSPVGQLFYGFLSKKWYFDVLNNAFITKPLLSFGYKVTFKYLDRGLVELCGPTGLVRLFSYLSSYVTGLQSGYLPHYLTLMSVGVFVALLILGFGVVLELKFIFIFVVLVFLYPLLFSKS